MLYKLLNEDAKAWWYHRDLRKAGNDAEARRRERESIKNKVNDIRNCAYVTVGRCGWTMHQIGGNATICGYGDMDCRTIRALIHCGVPVIDATTIHPDGVFAFIDLPSVKLRDDAHARGVPLAVFAAKARGLGATLHNINP